MARAAIRRDIDEEVDQERRGYSLDEAIESIAFGWFQIALLLLCGATQLADATELMVLSLLNNPVQCAFDVSKEEAAWLASAVFAGMLCGAYLTGLVADQFGRRAGFGMTTSLVAGFGLASAAAPSFELLVLARFFVGMGVGGANAALSLFVEYLPTRMRGLGLIFFFVFFSIGGVLEAGLAYMIMPNWRLLLFVTALPSAMLVICYPWVPESPRFLLIHGRMEEAKAALRAAATCNNSQLPPGDLTRMPLQAGVGRLGYPSFNRFLSEVQQLVGRGFLRRLSLSLWTLFFLMSVLYYALVQLTVSLSIPSPPKGHECDPVPSQAYWHVVVMNSGELPGLLVACCLLDLVGRKWSIALLSLLAALFSLCLMQAQEAQEASGDRATSAAAYLVAVMFAARACALGFNQSLWIYTAEAYPTRQRALGIGAASALARLGGVLCAVTALRLPFETKGQSLSDHMGTGEESGQSEVQNRLLGQHADEEGADYYQSEE